MEGDENFHPPHTDKVQPMARPKCSPFRPRASLSRLLACLRRPSDPGASIKRVKLPLHSTDTLNRPGPPPPEIRRPLPRLDPGLLCEHLVDLVYHLQSLVPTNCRWLKEGALEFVGERPVDAGGIADVWIGMMGGRKVAIKSYRCNSSSDYMPIYVVNDA